MFRQKLLLIWELHGIFKDATISCPQNQINTISTEAKIIGRKERALISRLESLLGKLIAFEKVIPFGRINYRFFNVRFLII